MKIVIIQGIFLITYLAKIALGIKSKISDSDLEKDYIDNSDCKK